MNSTIAHSTSLAPGGSMSGDTHPVVIVGAGITGLALGAELQRRGIDPIVLEQGERTGGYIGSVEKGGFLFECGPNTILDRAGAMDDLISWLGLEGEALRAPLADHARYIWHGGRLHEVPMGPGALLRSGLLSIGGKARLIGEIFIPAVCDDETLQSFAVRRLGREVYERMLAPMVAGIWAGDPAKMSTRASFGMLKELEEKSGSLIRGMLGRKKSLRAPHLLSFRRGLGQFTQGLAAKLGGSCRLRSRVESIRVNPAGGACEVSGARDGAAFTLCARHLVFTGDSGSTARLIERVDPALAAKLEAVHYAPIVAVGLGVKASEIHAPAGFGFLSVRNEGLRVLGAIFNSSFLPLRAPAGMTTLTVMMGGDPDPEAVNLNDDEILALARRDLGLAVGWTGSVEQVQIQRWPRAIPRYDMNHFELKRQIAETSARMPQVSFLGNWVGGVSVPDRIAAAGLEAERLAGLLARS